jgi:hypothetical protein
MGKNLRARPAFEPSKIAGVIEMAVRQQNGFDGLRCEAKFPDEPPDENRFAKQSGVNHHAVVAIFQQKAAAHDAADGVKVWRNISHHC